MFIIKHPKEDMKLSVFNNIIYDENDILIYNSFTQSLLRLNGDYARIFEKYCRSDNKNILTQDLVDNLKRGKMLVGRMTNEVENLKIMHNMARFSDSTCSLTIAPTMQCNFRCPYCYERNIEHKKMSKKVINKIKEFLKRIYNNSSYLKVAWYGGEPLLATDIIEEISEYAISLFGEKYFSSIVTNGYLLNTETAIKFKDLKIYQMQITLDGPPDIHNQLRKLPSGEDTFFVILNNIVNALENNPELRITIRVNTSKNNVGHIGEIMPYIDKYNLTERVNLYLAPVDNINNTCNSAECFNNTEFAIEQMRFIEENYKKNYNFVYLPQCNIGICGAIDSNSYVIDASGDLYKCWDTIGNKAEKIGSVFEGITLDANLFQWLSYDCFKDKECIKCSLLPACMGGCPHEKIKNGKKRCIPFKYNSERMVKLLYDLYKKTKLIEDKH